MGAMAMPMLAATSSAATSAIGAMSQISAGKQKQKAYEMEAKQAEMTGQAQSNERMRALNEALAMQSAAFGAQGRVGNVGSAQAIQQADIAKGLEDSDMIKAGAKSQSESMKLAGRQAKQQAYTGALMSVGQSMYQGSLIGGSSGSSTARSRMDARNANFSAYLNKQG